MAGNKRNGNAQRQSAPAFADKIQKRTIKNMTPNGTPYIDNSGTIIIPFNTDNKYHYWNGGQPLSDTMMELNVPENIWRNHTVKPYPGNAA
jgi:hypothetical protein